MNKGDISFYFSDVCKQFKLLSKRVNSWHDKTFGTDNDFSTYFPRADRGELYCYVRFGQSNKILQYSATVRMAINKAVSPIIVSHSSNPRVVIKYIILLVIGTSVMVIIIIKSRTLY